MDRDALHTFLTGWYGGLADSALREARPTVRFSRQIVSDDAVPTGGSKIGGRPDLPPGFVWPERQGTAHSFLAQVRLAEIATLDAAHPLPTTGTLYFFYDIWAGAWGFDPEDRGAWMVAYHPGDDSGLRRTDPPPSLVALDAEFPLLRGGLYTTCRLMPHATLTLPDRYSERGFPLATSLDAMRASEQAGGERADEEDEESSYARVLAEWRAMIPGPRHQMLGYPALVQSDMEVECQLASHGIYCGDGGWRDDPRTPALLPGAEDWLLLLQVDTDREANLEWGDSARLFYWIQRQALVACDFSHVWFVYQTH